MCRMPGNNKAVEISGFELAFLVANSSIPHGVVRVLSQLANLAASTPSFFISRSHKRIAEEVLCSESTVRRAFRWAVENGMLTKQAVVHEKSNARLPNLYRFSSSFLSYARHVKAKLIEKNLTFFSPVRAVRDVIASLRVFLNFHPQPPVQNEHPPLGQNDQAKNKNSSLRKTKQPDPDVAIRNTQITRREMIHEVAAAKAAGKNLRSSERHARERQLNEIADKKAKSFAWVKWFKGKPKRKLGLPEPEYNFEGIPTVATISDMMSRISGAAGSSFSDNSVPDGFRG